jgi:hypothetical protein
MNFSSLPRPARVDDRDGISACRNRIEMEGSLGICNGRIKDFRRFLIQAYELNFHGGYWSVLIVLECSNENDRSFGANVCAYDRTASTTDGRLSAG